MERFPAGDFDAAAEGFSDAYRRGVALYRAGHRFRAAEDAFDEVERASVRLTARYNLGNARFKQGDYTGAIDAYEQVLRRAPDHDDAHNNLTLARKACSPSRNKQAFEQGRTRAPRRPGTGKAPRNRTTRTASRPPAAARRRTTAASSPVRSPIRRPETTRTGRQTTPGQGLIRHPARRRTRRSNRPPSRHPMTPAPSARASVRTATGRTTKLHPTPTMPPAIARRSSASTSWAIGRASGPFSASTPTPA
jgi:hypothetical protein